MIQFHCGAYKYRNSFYSDRESLFDAMIINGDFDYYAKFYFNDDIFEKFDWTKEPQFSLDDLYKVRAKQIRDEYDYVILSYSGGSDSTEILETFLSCGLFIDEIQTVHYSELIRQMDEDTIANDESLAVMLEYKRAVLPKLRRVRELSPNTKITEIDVSNYTHEQISKNRFDYMGLTGHKTNGTGLIKPLRTNTFYMHNYNQQHFKGKGKVAFVRGYDKPILSIENGNLMFRFSDMPLHGVKLMRNNEVGEMYTFEDFFWSCKMPLIPIKQSHVIKKHIERDPSLFSSIMDYNTKMIHFNNTDSPSNLFTTQVMERIYSKMIYKYSSTIPFAAPKPPKNPELQIISKIEQNYSSEIMKEREQFYLSKYDKIKHKRMFRRTVLSRPYDIGPIEVKL
jgi:hypothetical protein